MKITREEAEAEGARIKNELMGDMTDEEWQALPSDKQWEIIQECGKPIALYMEQEKRERVEAGFAEDDTVGYLRYCFKQIEENSQNSKLKEREERDSLRYRLEEAVEIIDRLQPGSIWAKNVKKELKERFE